MDPTNPEPEDHGHEGTGHMPRPRPPRESLTPDFGQSTPALARTVRLVSGDFLLTVNPVDGSEIEPCPPRERPGRPVKSTAAERAESERAARPPVPPGPAGPVLPLLERQDERERLLRLLARGRSVRLTGPSGSGRTSVLDLVAEDCADLAPDGVVRLSGFHRTAGELLYDLFHAVYDAPGYRPERDELLGLVAEIGAVVVLDDIEFGGAALDELIGSTPECAFLISATPEVPAPSADSTVEEVFLGGLDRVGGVELLERAVGRALTEEEANWAGDLWFESEGLPLRFVQAGALLRQRDRLRASAGAVDEFGVFEDVRPASPLSASSERGGGPVPFDADAEDGEEAPLPSLGEAAAPAPLLASRLSASARATLRLAVALGGEVPHQAHLPALAGDTHADAALGELAGCGLVSPVGSRYRLAAGVQTQLEAAGYADDLVAEALTAARHYAWWAGHPSVTPERVCAEADAVLAALAVLVPRTPPAVEDEESPAVGLARTAAPAFASGLHWGAWERALRSGAEAARLAGDVAEQAYFHHELGVLALCGGQLDRARAELEASIGLHGALADKRGAVAGRRALALVADRAGDAPGAGAPAGGAGSGEEAPAGRRDQSAAPPGGVPAGFSAAVPPVGDTVVTHRIATPGPAPAPGPRGGLRRLARRNLVAAGSGALLAAVLGTVVTLGMTSHDSADDPSGKADVNPSAGQGADDGAPGADTLKDDSGDTGTATSRPTDPGPDGTLGTSDDPTPPPPAATTGPSDDPTGTRPGDDGTSGPSSKPPTGEPSTSKPPTSRPPTSKPPTTPSTSQPPPSESPTSQPPESSPSTSDSASGPASSAPAEASSSASAPDGTGSPSGPDSVI
ncbi:ATP-binding protein [Streptomyces sp. NPDC004629]|uniref:ATP-binding protein n=1 Tax=Streptomyces sp. NPDC004629 TaxID=3364705 RepID=UPI0036A317F9